VPHSFIAAVLEALAERAWPADRLLQMAGAIQRLGFLFVEPPMEDLAREMARGLGAQRSAYLALAVARDLPLVTWAEELLRNASARRPEDL